MTTHGEIRNSPEYLEWMEQELLEKITHNRKMREVVAGAISDLADMVMSEGEDLELYDHDFIRDAISKLQSAMEAEKFEFNFPVHFSSGNGGSSPYPSAQSRTVSQNS